MSSITIRPLCFHFSVPKCSLIHLLKNTNWWLMFDKTVQSWRLTEQMSSLMIKRLKWHITKIASQSFENENKGRDRRKLIVENHYHHHHHQHPLMTKMTMMTNHELKHNERSRWENHRWERTSLPAPQAHVRVTQRKWGALPAAFRERLRGACALSLAPGEGTQVSGLGR